MEYAHQTIAMEECNGKFRYLESVLANTVQMAENHYFRVEGKVACTLQECSLQGVSGERLARRRFSPFEKRTELWLVKTALPVALRCRGPLRGSRVRCSTKIRQRIRLLHDEGPDIPLTEELAAAW